MTWLQGLILALDTETTGVNPDADRVVTVCVGRSERPGDWRQQCLDLGYQDAPREPLGSDSNPSEKQPLTQS